MHLTNSHQWCWPEASLPFSFFPLTLGCRLSPCCSVNICVTLLAPQGLHMCTAHASLSPSTRLPWLLITASEAGMNTLPGISLCPLGKCLRAVHTAVGVPGQRPYASFIYFINQCRSALSGALRSERVFSGHLQKAGGVAGCGFKKAMMPSPEHPTVDRQGHPGQTPTVPI